MNIFNIKGLLYAVFGWVDKRTTPIVGTILSGFCAAAFAFFFSLGDLTSMISIGTLLAFTVVSGGVLVLRYQPIDDENHQNTLLPEKLEAPLLLGLYWIFCFLSAVTITIKLPLYLIILFLIPVLIVILLFWSLFETQNVPKTFKCPLVPLVPCLATYINILLICSLPISSFVRIIIWTCLFFSFFSLQFLFNNQY